MTFTALSNRTALLSTNAANKVLLSSSPTGPWTPAQVVGLAAWWDPSNAASLTASGGLVSQVDDLSGNGRHLVQATSGNRLSTGGTVHGLNVLTNPTGQHWMQTATNFPSSFTGGTVFWVGKRAVDSTVSGGPVVSFGDDHAIYSDLNMYETFATTTRRAYPVAAPMTETLVYALTGGAGDKRTWINGVLKFSDTSNTVGWATQFIVSGLGSSGRYLGDIGEIVFYDRVLSEDDRLAVELYLRQKWTDYVAPPPGLVVAWDFSDTAKITASSGAVSQVSGAYGTPFPLQQSTGSVQPTTGTRTINGLNVLDFAADWMRADPLGSLVTDTFTLYIAFQQDVANSQGLFDSAPGLGGVFRHIGAGWEIHPGDTAVTSTFADTSAPHLFTVQSHAPRRTLEVWRDGLLVGADSGTDTAINWTALVIGSINQGSGGYDFDGVIGEVRLYSVVHDATERGAVEDALMAKWGIPVPQQIAGLAAAWDFSDTSKITASSGAVSQVNGSYGTSVTLTQATGSRQPITGTVTINGRNVLDFNGGDDLLKAVLGASMTQPVTIFMVYRMDDTSYFKFLLDGGDGSNSETIYTYDGEGVMTAFAGGYLKGAAALNTALHLITVTYNSPTSSIRRDGVSDASGVTGTQSLLTDLVVGNRANGDLAVDGPIAEVLIYDALVAGSDRDAVEAYLKAKWGTP